MKSLWLGVFLLMLNMTAVCINMIEASKMQLGGLWKVGIKKGTEACVFSHVCLEKGEKTVIYTSIQKSCCIDLELAVGQEFVLHMLMDSIFDEKDYLTVETKRLLDNVCLPEQNEKLMEYAADYLRVIGMYYVYLLKKQPKDVRTRNIVRSNWKYITNEYSTFQWGKKMLDTVMEREAFDLYDVFEQYEGKNKYVYSLLENLRKL